MKKLFENIGGNSFKLESSPSMGEPVSGINEKEDYGDQLRRELRNALKAKDAEKAVYYNNALNSDVSAVASFDGGEGTSKFKGSWAYEQWLKKPEIQKAIADQQAEFKSNSWMEENTKEELSKFNKKEVMMGIEVEKEHTKDIKKLKQIVIDHLKENPHYYTKLKAAGLEESYQSFLKIRESNPWKNEQESIEYDKKEAFIKRWEDTKILNESSDETLETAKTAYKKVLVIYDFI